MSSLLRAPERVGAWRWDLEDRAEPGLVSALRTAARMSDVLRKHGLMHAAERLRWGWFAEGVGGLGITTELSLFNSSLDDEDLPRRVLGCRPEAFPTAEILGIFVLGRGSYLDAAGRERSEDGLVELIVHPVDDGLSATLGVYHDIWDDYDFSGRPHPEVHERNAPRFAAALRDIDELLGVPADAEDSTYFGMAEGRGLERTDPDDLVDGLALDRSDRL